MSIRNFGQQSRATGLGDAQRWCRELLRADGRLAHPLPLRPLETLRVMELLLILSPFVAVALALVVPAFSGQPARSVPARVRARNRPDRRAARQPRSVTSASLGGLAGASASWLRLG